MSNPYPNLLSPGQTINTIAASQLLVTYDWPENSERYARVARFVDAFFSKIDEFQKPPRHPKWSESSIVAAIPGWQRFKASEDWLAAHNLTPPTTRSVDADRMKFERFLLDKRIPDASDPEKREAMLHDIQKILHERTRFAPIWDYFWPSGIGPRVEEAALMKIDPYPWSAPLEDVKLKRP